MLTTKARKLIDDGRAKLEAELAKDPRARGILTPDAIRLLESRHLSAKARDLLIKSAVDQHLRGAKRKAS